MMWVNLIKMTPSVRCQIKKKKNTCHMIPCTYNSRIGKLNRSDIKQSTGR